MDFKTSRAIVIEQPRRVSFRSIELTPLQPDSYVAQSTMCTISSGTDMKTWRGHQPPEALYYPCVPGYENVGKIVYAGEETNDFKIGDRVMINECRQYKNICAAWGGGSEFSVKDSTTSPSPFDYMVRIPENVSDRDAVLAYIPCVALKGIRRMTLKPEETVVVIGAGMMGISALQILKIACPNIRTVCIERNAFRRAIAEHYADYVIPDTGAVKHLLDITNGKKADKIIECSGNTAVVGSLHQYIKDGGWSYDDEPGHIHLQGDYPGRIVLDSYNFWFNTNCTLTMSCALAPGCKEQILQWMSEGKFDTSHFPTEVFPANKCAEAYEFKENNGDEIFKVLFDWTQC